MKTTTILILATLLAVIAPVRAEEGMWLFERLPYERIRRDVGVQLTDEWLEHVQKSSLRFDTGGSGSFVGPYGLAITNHHVVRGGLVRLSTPERDIQTNGYLARTQAEELAIPDLAVRSLWEIEDVTARVKQTGENLSASAAEQARRGEIAAIESEAQAATGMECEVVTLYNGGLYHLYSYKRWTDVRLVWAPEGAIAHFGGDVDNFRYPRYCLDAAIVRVYDDEGNAVRPEQYLGYATEGLDDGEATFVSGHPGSTRRLLTTDHLRFLRDTIWPMQLNYAFRRQVELERFAANHPEHAHLIMRDLPGIKNWRKAVDDRLRALQTGPVFQKKLDAEGAFIFRISNDDTLTDAVRDAYSDVSAAQDVYRAFYREHFLTGRSVMNRSDLYAIAERLVRRAAMLELPEGERLDGYADARLSEVERRIMTQTPIAPALEEHRIATWLGLYMESVGPEKPVIRAIIGDVSTRVRAEGLVRGTRLADTAFREELMVMSIDELAAVDDPMLALAYTLEPLSRSFINWHDAEVVAVEREAYDTISDARFRVFGTNDYPDATFTLRLSYGTVGGYEDVPAFTTVSGLRERYDERGPGEPFDLPQRWVDAMDTLPADTPFNLISDQHIIGGNSGSPLIDVRARFAGVIFDGNEASASWGSIYDNTRARSVSVDGRLILEALRRVYDAGFLVEQLTAE